MRLDTVSDASGRTEGSDCKLSHTGRVADHPWRMKMVNLVFMLIIAGSWGQPATRRGGAEAVTVPSLCRRGWWRMKSMVGSFVQRWGACLAWDMRGGKWLCWERDSPLGGRGSPQLSSDFLTLGSAVSHYLWLESSAGEGDVLIFKGYLEMFLRRAQSEVCRKGHLQKRQKSQWTSNIYHLYSSLYLSR